MCFNNFPNMLILFFVLICFRSQLEAEAMVELLADEYPDIKYWISFQCKVVCMRFLCCYVRLSPTA